MLVFSILQIYEQYVYIKYMLYQFWHIHVVQFYLIPLNICKTQMMIGEQSEHDQLWLPTMTHFFLGIDCDKGFSQYTSRFRPSVMVCKLNFIVVKLVKEEDLVDFLHYIMRPVKCFIFFILIVTMASGRFLLSVIVFQLDLISVKLLTFCGHIIGRMLQPLLSSLTTNISSESMDSQHLF